MMETSKAANRGLPGGSKERPPMRKRVTRALTVPLVAAAVLAGGGAAPARQRQRHGHRRSSRTGRQEHAGRQADSRARAWRIRRFLELEQRDCLPATERLSRRRRGEPAARCGVGLGIPAECPTDHPGADRARGALLRRLPDQRRGRGGPRSQGPCYVAAYIPDKGESPADLTYMSPGRNWQAATSSPGQSRRRN